MRFYYTDSLAACWMIKHHKITYQIKDSHIVSFSQLQKIPEIWLNSPIYLHPDSLYLLEPQIGDMVIGCGKHGGVAHRIDDSLLESLQKIPNVKCNTIQRNEMAFIFPEMEVEL